MKALVILGLFLGLSTIRLSAQDVSFMLDEGQQLEAQKKDAEALRKYQDAVRIAPNNVAVLCKISELNSILGNREADKKNKVDYFTAARMYAERALKADASSAQANYVMALAKAKLTEVSSPKEKIQFVKEIKAFADKALAEDSMHYQSMYLLGKWNVEVSSLNGAEKAAVKLFGGLPPASLIEAINLFEKVRKVKPAFVANYLDLAKAYSLNGQSLKAIEVLNRLVRLAPKTADDENYKAEGKKLLESLL